MCELIHLLLTDSPPCTQEHLTACQLAYDRHIARARVGTPEYQRATIRSVAGVRLDDIHFCDLMTVALEVVSMVSEEEGWSKEVAAAKCGMVEDAERETDHPTAQSIRSCYRARPHRSLLRTHTDGGRLHPCLAHV